VLGFRLVELVDVVAKLLIVSRMSGGLLKADIKQTVYKYSDES